MFASAKKEKERKRGERKRGEWKKSTMTEKGLREWERWEAGIENEGLREQVGRLGREREERRRAREKGRLRK